MKLDGCLRWMGPMSSGRFGLGSLATGSALGRFPSGMVSTWCTTTCWRCCHLRTLDWIEFIEEHIVNQLSLNEMNARATVYFGSQWGNRWLCSHCEPHCVVSVSHIGQQNAGIASRASSKVRAKEGLAGDRASPDLSKSKCLVCISKWIWILQHLIFVELNGLAMVYVWTAETWNEVFAHPHFMNCIRDILKVPATLIKTLNGKISLAS